MMRNEDESLQQQSASHISYKDYKKILKTNKPQSLKMFLWAFFVLLLIFLGLAKMMSPDVDITLGDDTSDNVIEYEEENMPRGEIDDRLRVIQMEDESVALGGDSFAVEDGEKVTIPKHDKEREQVVENKLPEELIGQKAVKDVVGESVKLKPEAVSHPQQVNSTSPQPQVQAPAPIVQAVTARVIVGNYTTAEQAEVAKTILQDAGLGVSPFVRKMGNGYTLQVASYSSKEKAMSVAESLLNQNFPAKVIVEYKNN